MKNKLKFHTKKDLPIHKLPFVGGKANGRLGVSFWDVPDKGGYGGGNTTGSALALIFLKHLQENGSTHGGILGNIASDMSGICNDCKTEDDARRGQMIGFFNTIEPVLAQLIERAGIKFTLSDVQLLQKANDGLSGHR